MADEEKKAPSQIELLRERVVRLHSLTNTPEGRELVEMLRRQFLTRLSPGKDDREVAFHHGEVNVVAWLMEAQQYNPEGR